MHRLEWKKQARKDLLKIIEHIAQDSPDSADKLADDIEAKTQQLREHPKLYRVGRKRGTRELVAHQHYIVIYRVLAAKIEVLRVKHTAQQWPIS
ncbi:type II toxin-antitoxin system RelE/ParE family toxin [Paraherbaspirillum soli]|uniref:Type II toxin-antitoxin system RelE/ParE family toxin n=1 Tax=Paraherbaspirillum soli TaxID=631222 RepID=A0ABW0M7M8_9BURK